MHNDLYDKEEYIGPAVAKLTEFFTKNLAPSTTRGKQPAPRSGSRSARPPMMGRTSPD
jgi:hypothetical protein